MSQDKTERMEYFISLLDDYIDGKLSGGQTTEIEKALKEDSFLNEVLKQHVQARSNMRTAGEAELRNKFANSFEPIPEVVKPRSNFLKVLVPIILLLGLVAAAYYYFSTQEQPETDRRHIASLENDQLLLASVGDPSYDLLRSNKDTMVADRWQRAVEYFIDQNYKEANYILSTLEKDTAFISDHLGKFSLMKGVANLKMEKYNIADQALSQITPDNPYFDQAEWYLALTYFYGGDKGEATKQLKQIVDDSSHYKQRQAQGYLDDLAK